MTPNEISYSHILPEVVLSVFGMLIMLAEPMLGERASRKPLGYLAFFGTLAAGAATLYQAQYPGFAFWHMVHVDAFSTFFHLLVIGVAAVVILSSLDYVEEETVHAGEYYGLVLLGAVGMCLMSSAVELVLIFVALEISSIATYVLTGIRRKNAAGAESALKYFLLGSFATAFFLFGVAMMYGATGSTDIPNIALTLAKGSIPGLVYVGMALMFVGLGFKIASAPFHVWTPDVYEGAPAPIVGFMSTAPKAAVFAVMLRIILQTGAPGWLYLIWGSAALSMTLGNLGALLQTNVKRMLAYSSIAQAGYILVAFTAAPQEATSAVMFYMLCYAAMNVGAFAVITFYSGKDERRVHLEDFAGLGATNPLLALTLTIFLLSLIGIPLTGGFLAKFYVFQVALKANMVWLTIIGVLNSAVAAYYYLRLVVAMYMKPAPEGAVRVAAPLPMKIALLAAAALTLYLGIVPTGVLSYTTEAAAQLLTAPAVKVVTGQ